MESRLRLPARPAHGGQGGLRAAVAGGPASPSDLGNVPRSPFPSAQTPNPLPSVLVKPCPSRPPQGAGWTGSLTLRADVRLPHIRAYGNNRDRHAAAKGDPSLDPGPCRPSSPAGSSSAAPPTSRDLADPVQLRLALHGHPLQGGQVEHRAAADVVIVVPAPVEIVVRELVTSEGERGLRHQAQAAPTPRTDQRDAWHKLGTPPPNLG